MILLQAQPADTNCARMQEIVLNIEPQEYLCRTVVTIIPVTQLADYQKPQHLQRQPQQTAQQVTALCLRTCLSGSPPLTALHSCAQLKQPSKENSEEVSD